MNIVEMLRDTLRSPEPDTGPTEFIYALLPEDLDPLDRCAHYADALDAELKMAKVGWVSGGGSMLGPDQPDGSSKVEFSGIDFDVTDVAAARQILRVQLSTLGCLAGTELHYCEGAARLQDEYDGRAWSLAKPRTRLHPGFGL